MKQFFFGIGSILSVLTVVWGADYPAGINSEMAAYEFAAVDSADSVQLHFPFHDRYTDRYSDPSGQSPMYMNDPSNVKTDVQYDPDNNRYNINENIGQLYYRNPSYMTYEEFVEHEFNKSTRAYWKQRAGEEDKLTKKSFTPKITINSVVFDRIFGGNTIDIRPQGSAELIFGINSSKSENPAIPIRQRRVTTFDFRERIQMNVIANIGTKMKLTTNYNTEATFDFENRMKIEYSGDEDDIIKKIEAGNITMPLGGTLIQGSQSLFGLKTTLQFGRLTVTGLFSQQRGKAETINVQGGAQTTTFDIKADQYEDNRHFFLAQYFKDTYDQNLRVINRLGTSLNITRVEVWVTTRTFVSTQNLQNRNIIAFADLGESMPDTSQTLIGATGATSRPPADSLNQLYQTLDAALPGGIGSLRTISNSALIPSSTPGANFTRTKNFETVENARLLQPSEYTLNNRLGYISLNTKLRPNDVLAVSFEYTINGQVFRVGELSAISSAQAPNALFVKLIHSSNYSPKYYTWDLMMKNIYSIGGFNISQEKFRLDVLYQDDRIGGNINFIPTGCTDVKGIPLIRLLNMDQLDVQGNPVPDGVFDFVPGITINPQSGRITFPVREPFGSYVRAKFCGDQNEANFYAYDALYDSTKTSAQQQPEKNKFILRGTFQSSSGSEIPLNAVNIPQGSVKVTAGGVQLRENVDYTVDYTLGRVKIINDSYLKSNTPIQINLESNSLFALQTKSLIGTRFDYNFNKKLQFGGTMMHLYERPLTQKVNVGDEPVSNTVFGLDGNYRTDSRFLTKLLDRLPFYSTKETSTLTFGAEYAQLVPGSAAAIGKGGISYVDDFEGAITPLDMRNPSSWYLSSIPEGQTEQALFPETIEDSSKAGYNRSRMAWYYIDPLFQRTQSQTPGDIDVDDQSNNFVREVSQTEIFPNRPQPFGPQSIICMNVAYYPEEKGPYNYDAEPTAFSKGMTVGGGLAAPETRWGGIMRKIETTDFEYNNIEFIQFWMMDPFANGTPNDGSGGEVYFNIGSLSEDILRDQKKSFENGFPASTNNYTTGTTAWGYFPIEQSIVNAFDNDPNSIRAQDIGLDGLSDVNERGFFNNYLTRIANYTGAASQAYSNALQDPSNDDFLFFLDGSYSSSNTPPLERYKRWNGMEGNSSSTGTNLTISTTLPDMEDINRDNNMNIAENYFQYKVTLKPSNMVVGQNYISDVIESPVRYQNNTTGQVKWYQFKIPVRFPEKTIGTPEYTNIEFIRMVMKNFQKPIICRFARLEFLRGEWRRYIFSLLQPGEYSPTPEIPGNTTFDIASVSIEENGNKVPVNYKLPPGIQKERDLSAPQLATLNEQSLSLRVCELVDGDARGAYRNTQLDVRSYKKLKMFVHAESNPTSTPLNDGELHAFLRIGTDFNDNFYEYDIPLKVTSPGAGTAEEIWPSINDMEIELDKLISAKLLRNNAIQMGQGVTLLTPYRVTDGNNTIIIKGTPNLSNVRSIMVGIRNPKDPDGSGRNLCGEVWFNELRLTDFDQSGGWAATARMTAKLADLGTFSLVGYHSTPNWGALEKKVSERNRFTKSSYDLSTTIELGKFFPEKLGLKVPMFFGYSEQKITPQYNPLDPDVLFNRSLDATNNPEVRDSVEKNGQDYTQRKSLNFTNVRKTKVGGSKKNHVYDVENLNLTYAYTETYQRNYNIEYSIAKTYQGILGYNFNNTSKPITPFEKSKSKTLNSKWLKFVKDFNFNPLPTGLNFRASLDRTYSETQLRNNTPGILYRLDPTYVKTFTMQRNYGLTWDLVRALKIDFNADASAIIDEPAGRIDTREERDSIRRNLRNLGRLNRYHHATNITYTLPFAKFPITDWISGNVRYGADYSWQSAPLFFDTARNVVTAENPWGNTIQNSQTVQWNGNFTLTTLYNKVPFLRNLNKPPQRDGDKPKTPALKLPKDSLQSKKDSTKVKGPSPLEPVFNGLGRLITMVKTISGTYSETNGISLPGFTPKPDFIGQDWNHSSGVNAPGLAFLFGDQADIRIPAVRNRWLTYDTTLNAFYTRTKMQNLSVRATIEPVRSFKIEISGNRNYTLNVNENFRYVQSSDNFESLFRTETGNFSISYLTWSTHFVKDANNYSNKNFQEFVRNRQNMSQFLASQNPNTTTSDTGYASGYGPSQPEVLTYAFLSAYSGRSPSAKLTKQFPTIPLPNWRVTYDGLSKLKFFQKFLQSLTLSHGYRSIYSINSFNRNLLYKEQGNYASNRDTLTNFIPRFDIQQITISEQLAPLIGIDMTWKNSLQTRFEIKRDRTLTLAYSNIQVTEVRGTEYTVGLGYKFKKVVLPIRLGNGKKLSNDLNVRIDVNLRDNKTILRKVIEGTNQPSAGTKTLGVKISADYPVNDRFNVRAFYDYNANNPFVSSSYPTSNTNFGISIRFTLAQ